MATVLESDTNFWRSLLGSVLMHLEYELFSNLSMAPFWVASFTGVMVGKTIIFCGLGETLS